MNFIRENEPDQTRRRVFFHVVSLDGITPALGEGDGQPWVSVGGNDWQTSGIGTLSPIGDGRYFAELEPELLVAGRRLETRYKGGATAEVPGDSVLVVAFDPAEGPDGGDAGGPGAEPCTLHFAADGIDIADADVWVTADAEGAVLVQGTKQTNSDGDVTFLLDPGADYFVWLQKDGVNPIEGEPYTAEAD